LAHVVVQILVDDKLVFVEEFVIEAERSFLEEEALYFSWKEDIHHFTVERIFSASSFI
jgi:hypothetical protein